MWIAVSVLLLFNVLFSNPIEELERKAKKREKTKKVRDENKATSDGKETYDITKCTENNLVPQTREISNMKLRTPKNPSEEFVDDPTSVVKLTASPLPFTEVVLSDEGSDGDEENTGEEISDSGSDENSMSFHGDEENIGEPSSPFRDEGMVYEIPHTSKESETGSNLDLNENKRVPKSSNEMFYESVGADGLSLGDSISDYTDDDISFAASNKTGTESIAGKL